MEWQGEGEQGSRPPALRDSGMAGLTYLVPCARHAKPVLAWFCPRTTIAPGLFGVIILDGAGWHQTGGRLAVPANLALLHLLLYSPEPWILFAAQPG